jgi:hypothetical protein
MRDGQAHDLIPSPEDTREGRPVKYRGNGCGKGYQVRTSAPSCRVPLLEQIQQLDAPYANLAPAARRALLEELVRRRFKWPRPLRDVMLEHFDRWTAWKSRRIASCGQ